MAAEVSATPQRRAGSTTQAAAATSAGVALARQRLMHGGTEEPSFAHELNVMFARNEIGAQATLLLLAGIFSLASMYWAHWSQALTWLAIVIGAKVLLLEFCRRYLQVPTAELNLETWRRRLLLAEATNGITWAGFALVGAFGGAGLSEEHYFSSHVFVFASLIVILAIRMTLASPLLPILYVGTVPMTIAVVGRLAMQGDTFHLALASMAIGVHIYFVFLAKGLNATALQMLRFRAQKDLLIAELEEAKLMSDEARRRAEEANIAKSRFLATMSHELRTPLNAILGFSEVMHSEIMGPMENKLYKEYAGNVHHSGSHLLHLINEILDLSRIEAGRYELNESAIRLIDVVDDCHRLLKLRLEGKALKVIEAFDESVPPVWADERAIRQVVLNLMSNALKFTPKGGAITLTVARTESGGQFVSVRDTGPGIPKDEIPKVMEAFGQGSLAHKTAEGGTGLGLPIVKNLVELHGGTFELTSEVRKGTVVTAFFPRQRVLEPAVPVAAAGQRAGKSGAPQRAPAAPAPMAPPQSTSVRPARLKQIGAARRTPQAAAR